METFLNSGMFWGSLALTIIIGYSLIALRYEKKQEVVQG